MSNASAGDVTGGDADDSRKLTRTESLTVLGGLFGVLPLLFCGVRILTVSQGDIQTLRMLVQDLDVKALVLATVLPIAGTVAFWIQLGLLLYGIAPASQPRAKRNARALFMILLPVTIALVVKGMSTRQFAINAAVFGVLVVLFIIGRMLRGRTAARLIALIVALIIVFGGEAGVIFISFDNAMWLPLERMQMVSGSVVDGYVLSSNGDWTSYMDLNRKISIVPTPAVALREVVATT